MINNGQMDILNLTINDTRYVNGCRKAKKRLVSILQTIPVLLLPFSSFAHIKTFQAWINSLIRQITLDEKVGMTPVNSSFTSAGVSSLGIPELVKSDGPHGAGVAHGSGWNKLQKVNDSGTCLPVAIALTWNTVPGFGYGKVLGSGANYMGKDVILFTFISIMRTPFRGRICECLNEDTYLVTH